MHATLPFMMLLALSCPLLAESSDSSDAGKPAPAPDNSAVNVQDRHDANPTPQNQNLTEPDRKLLQSIRSAIVKDDNLSIDGYNVKILVDNGKVTLRGPVKDAEEMRQICEITKRTPGVTSFDNQLESLKRD